MIITSLSQQTDPGDGWINPAEVWTYVSATTFTIAGDKSIKYSKGDRIKVTQTTVKYFYVIGVSFATGTTTITITGGSDYTLANAAITLNYFSKVNSPNGFPNWFNWAPTITGFTSPPTSSFYRFCIIGSTCFLEIGQGLGTSNATTLTITLPVTSATSAASFLGAGPVLLIDNGARPTSPGFVLIGSAATALAAYKDFALNGFTASGNKSLNFVAVSYEI